MVDKDKLKALLERYNNQQIPLDQLIHSLYSLFIEEIGEEIKLDLFRRERKGFPEVIFGEKKTRDQLKTVVRSFIERKEDLIITRVKKEDGLFLCHLYPELNYESKGRLLFVQFNKKGKDKGPVAVVTGGSSDLEVAEEASILCELFGNRVERVYDVGVSGIHRLVPYLDVLKRSKVVIVVAGMEGALPSLIGGLVSVPVIAVPTSVGYGASFGGIAALLAMLNSCAPGVVVVNIDNGFGAAYTASLITGALG